MTPECALNTIWDALHAYREDCIPEGEELNDNLWGDVCEAMDFVRSELSVPDPAYEDRDRYEPTEAEEWHDYDPDC